ncbi:MAG: acetate kinase [Anaerovoracaceae bacterium]|nr:acetate kinase [Bacillota bacterium]MDY2670019.1 acetate kinase [Anaerovoracaceae bacterium]
MKVLVINCGSSSVKYQIIETETAEVLCKGLCELAGEKSTFSYEKAGADKMKETLNFADHGEAVARIISTITDPEIGVIKDASEIGGIGHRILHGGDKYTESILVDQDVKDAIEECIPLGPLHNPANLIGIEAAEKAMPGTPNVAVFDTAFHQTMPPEAFLYAVPYNYYTDYKVRKYGFHGTSHRYISLKAPELLGKKPEEVKLINCHIGNGASLAAIEYGKCVDTSMGISPLEGLMMGTRSGDIDPTVVTYIMQKEGKTAEEMLTILNKKSGLLGICGMSDMREVDSAAEAGDEMAELALKMYARRIKGYIGNYYVQLGGCDAIVFTAGIGEHDAEMRARVCEGLDLIGIKLDPEKNAKGEDIISTDDSPVKILLVPTDEELMIARDTAEIVSGLNK